MHDLAHYAVETELRHRLGFFGLLAEGWDFPDFAENRGRRPMQADADPSELIVGLLDAERAGGCPSRPSDRTYASSPACRLRRQAFSDAMSITKRYFTSLRTIRSYASLIFWIGVSSISDTMPLSAQ